MEKAKFAPSDFNGKISIPPSKSFAHRAMICAALCGGDVRIDNIASSRDMEATENFLAAVGIEVMPTENGIRLSGGLKIPEAPVAVNCIESGSTLRFVIPVMAALGIETEFVGEGRLPSRPIGIYSALLPEHGVEFTGEGLPCKIKGKLKSGDYYVPGNISSQFITGLMLALPLLEGDSRIIITTQIESQGYLDITVGVLAAYGVLIERTDYGYLVKGNQRYKRHDYTVEGDWSQAAFFFNLAALSGGEISISGLNENSLQGDRSCVDLYSRIGVRCRFEAGELIVNGGELHALDVSASEIPDMVPALAVCLAVSDGKSTIYDAGRLRIKESDRLSAVANMISGLGGRISEEGDSLVIHGVPMFRGGTVDGCNDHRIVMAAATAAAKSAGDIVVSDAMSVNKSYPDFYRDYNSIGGKADVVGLGK